jgi:O-antigen/teichoic acid export membrane protein
MLSLSAVAFYSIPGEVVTRLWIIPMSLSSALLPAVSEMQGRKDEHNAVGLFSASLKCTLILSGITVGMCILWAKEILVLWLGPEFAHNSTLVMQILLVGMFINSQAIIQYSMLHATGRPRITACFHLFELPMHACLLLVLIRAWGIEGAALAWTARIVIDTVLLFGAGAHLSPGSARRLWQARVPKVAGVMLAQIGLSFLVSMLDATLMIKGAVTAGECLIGGYYCLRVDVLERVRLRDLTWSGTNARQAGIDVNDGR